MFWKTLRDWKEELQNLPQFSEDLKGKVAEVLSDVKRTDVMKLSRILPTMALTITKNWDRDVTELFPVYQKLSAFPIDKLAEYAFDYTAYQDSEPVAFSGDLLINRSLLFYAGIPSRDNTSDRG